MAKKVNSTLERQLSYNSELMGLRGSRYAITNSDVPLARDVDALFAQYKPLRLRVYGQLNHGITKQADQEDLTSFINEHFVRLVKEYDPSSGVDLPGYISIMLPMRSKYSFLGSLLKLADKEGTTEGDDEVLTFLENTTESFIEDNQHEFLAYLHETVRMDEMEDEVLGLLLAHSRPSVIERSLRDEFGLNTKEAKETIQEVKDAVGYVYKRYLEE